MVRSAWWWGGLAVAGSLLVWVGATGADATAASGSKENRYVGADRCKMCHAAEEGGNQFAKWQEMKHAHAFEVLKTDEAKAIAAERGLGDPTKEAECLRCHETAHGAGFDQVHPRFPRNRGVQCESCHGPGEKHFEIRLRAAASKEELPITADEIITQPPKETCLGCHNEQSPSFQPFCMKSFASKIEHLDPRKERTEAELDARRCKCGDDCACTQGECGEPWK